jgi:hypothetical protein
MLTGTLRPIKILSLLPLTPAKIPLVKRISNIKEADFSFSYQDLMFLSSSQDYHHCMSAGPFTKEVGCLADLLIAIRLLKFSFQLPYRRTIFLEYYLFHPNTSNIRSNK